MRTCLLALVLALAAPATALAETTTVDPAATGCARGATCKTINGAVGASQANDTIRILPGIYAEDVAVPAGKDGLVLAGDAGSLISGTGGASNLSIAAGAVSVRGLAIIKAAGTDPAVSATGGRLALTDTAVFATGGDAVAVSGADNVIQRATVLDTATANGADGIALGAGGLRVDSSVVLGGSKGVGFRVTTAEGSDPATLTLDHVSTTGAGGIALEAPDPPAQVQKVGDITLAVNASIIHGTSTASESDGQKDPLLGTQLVAPSTVKATYTSSDATQMTKAAGSPGDPEISGGGNPTADSALFRAGTALRLTPSAPVIDKGGAIAAGESDRDIDGEPRTNGAATDIGADEFTNHPPALTLSIDPAAPKTGQIVTATALAKDAEGSGDVKGYLIDWGDGKRDTTASNVIQHVYEKSGPYTVTMIAADQSLATSPVVTKAITVTDGRPPQLQVTTPKQGATVKLTRKARKKGAKPRSRAFLIKGVDADESGLASIELAITKKGSKCKQYSGSKLVGGGCTKYRFLKAKLSGNGFSLKAKRLVKGRYEIRARGTDTKGNATSGFDRAVKTLVSFKVR